MSIAFPLPAQTRQAILTASAGQTVFGPLDFILFDEDDIEVWAKVPPATVFSKVDSGTVTVTPAAPATSFPAAPTVTLGVARSAGDVIWIKGKRLGSRTTNVTRGGVVQSQPLESELDRQVATSQELRRDVDALLAGATALPALASGIANDSIVPGGTVADALTLLKNSAGGGVINITDKPYGAKGDGATNNNAAIVKAIAAAAAMSILIDGGATVLIPSGAFRITQAINLPVTVNLVGLGGRSSIIIADNCDAVTLQPNVGFGMQYISGIHFTQQNATVGYSAFRQPATTDFNDRLFGLTIRDNLFTYFDICINIRSVQNFEISNNWGQYLNMGIVFNGFVANGVVFNNNFTVAGGPGGAYPASGHTGIEMSPYNYTVNGNPAGPEGVTILKNQFFQFNIGCDIVQTNWVTIDHNNFVATVYGIRASTAQDHLCITNNDVELQQSTAVAGIYLVEQSGLIESKTLIEGNLINAGNGITSCHGIQVNSAAATLHDDVVITANYIKNMRGYDILFYNPGGNNQIINNKCMSGLTTASIRIGTRQTGITVTQNNFCAKTLVYDTAADLTNGYIRRSGNVYNGGTAEPSNWAVEALPGQLPATATNDVAGVGKLGEYFESVVTGGTAVALASGADKTITSITLTAGDWDVSALANFAPAATTNITQLMASISLTTNVVDVTPGRAAAFFFPAFVPGGSFQSTPIPSYRLSLNAAATIYLTARGTFTVSTLSAYGIIRARRVR